MEIIALGIVAVAAIGALVFQQWLHSRLVKDLNTRLMAKSLEEYKYFTEVFKKDVKEAEKAREQVKEDIAGEVVDEGNEATAKFLRDVEEDFDVNEVDIDKLKESIRNEEKE